MVSKKYQTSKRQVVGVIGLTSVWFLGYIIAMIPNVIANVRTPYIAWAGEPSVTIGSILANPIHSVATLGITIWFNIDDYLMGIVGKTLGWHDTPIMLVVVVAFIIFFVLGVFVSREEVVKITGKAKVLMGTIVILSTGLIFVAMWLAWTPITSSMIHGVQGRYFIPLLPLLIGICHTKVLTWNRNISNELLFGLLLLQVLTVFNLVAFAL
jgi:uncharacterized membrane protein